MVLPTTPPDPMSGSQILAEFGIAPGETKTISNDLYPLIGGTPGSICIIGAYFSGQSAGPTEWIAAMNFGNGGRGLMVTTDGTSFYVAGQISTGQVPIAWDAAGTYLIQGPAAVSSAAVLVKYNAAGTPLWITTIDGAGVDQIGYVTSRFGSIYVSGRAGTTWPTAKNAANPSIGKTITGTVGTIGWWIAKYDPNGEALHMIGITGGSGGAQNASVFDIGDDYCIVAAGRSSGSGQTINAYGPGGSSVVSANAPTFSPNFALCWVARWDSDGVPQWVRFNRTNSVGGFGTGVAIGTYNNYPAAVVVSGCGNSVSPTAYDAAGILYQTSQQPALATNTTCVSLTEDFGGIDWITVITNTYINDTIGSASVASYPGNLNQSPYYVCGTSVSGIAPTAYSAGTNTGVTAVPVPSGRGAWLAKFSHDGQVLWIATIDGIGDNYATAVNVDLNNFIYVNVTVTDQNTVNAYNAGSTTSFVTCAASQGSGTAVIKYDTNGTAIDTCISYNFNIGLRLVNNLIVNSGKRYKTGSTNGGTFDWEFKTPEGSTVTSTNQQVGILVSF
jgi:hypothetical protein